MTPNILINASAQDVGNLIDIQVTRDPANALLLIADTFKQLESNQTARVNLRKTLARAARNALKKLQTGSAL